MRTTVQATEAVTISTQTVGVNAGRPRLRRHNTHPASNGSGSGPLQYNGTFVGGGSIGSTGQPIGSTEPTVFSIDLRVLFVRRKDAAAAGLTYTPQFSTDLITWTDASVIPTILADNGSYEIVSIPYSPFIQGKKARFFRVTLSLTP